MAGDPWSQMAREFRNSDFGLHDEKGREIGATEEGDDGFLQVIIHGRLGFQKVWVRPAGRFARRTLLRYLHRPTPSPDAPAAWFGCALETSSAHFTPNPPPSVQSRERLQLTSDQVSPALPVRRGHSPYAGPDMVFLVHDALGVARGWCLEGKEYRFAFALRGSKRLHHFANFPPFDDSGIEYSQEDEIQPPVWKAVAPPKYQWFDRDGPIPNAGEAPPERGPL